MDLLRLALVGGLVGLDTTAAFQFMICQPLVGGLMTGWALGDPLTGAYVGLLLQGLFLAEIPAGGRIFPDGNMAAVQAAALAVYAQKSLGFSLSSGLLCAFLWALPTAVLGGQVMVWTRRLHGRYLPLFDRLIASGRTGALNSLFVAIIAENFLIAAAFTMVLHLIGRLMVHRVAGLWINQPLISAWGGSMAGGLLGAGCAVIFISLFPAAKKGKIWSLAAGLLLCALIEMASS